MSIALERRIIGFQKPATGESRFKEVFQGYDSFRKKRAKRRERGYLP